MWRGPRGVDKVHEIPHWEVLRLVHVNEIPGIFGSDPVGAAKCVGDGGMVEWTG